MKYIESLISNFSTGPIYTYGAVIWGILWLIPVGYIHIISVLLWEIPYLIPTSASSSQFFYATLLIKILILAYPISTLNPWNMLKTTFFGLILFMATILALSYLPPDFTLKNIFMDVGFISKAYTVLLYLLYSNIFIPILARNDLKPYNFLYISLGIDEILTVLFRSYIHFSIPAISAMAIGISVLLTKNAKLRGAER